MAWSDKFCATHTITPFTTRGSVIRLKMVPVLLLSILLVVPGLHAAQPDRDFTCFVFSDIHLGTDKPKATPPVTPELMLKRMNAHLDEMRKRVGTPFPKKGPLQDIDLGRVEAPRGLFILGDLTDGSPDNARRQDQWKTFLDVFPAAGLPFGEKTVPVYAMLGNHDGELAGPQGQGLVAHHREMARANRFTTLAENGLHFALDWDGIHFICLNICPADSVDEQALFKYGKPGKGSWNDPQGALTFLKDYLKKNVGDSQQPVFIMHHYGFDGFSLNDWNWWTPRQRRAYYDAIRDYNIVALIHGHNHAAEHYRWPQAKRHAGDISAMFGATPPEKVREFDVISCGPVCWVFRFKGDEFYASHLGSTDWNSNPMFHLRKSMQATCTPAAVPQ